MNVRPRRKLQELVGKQTYKKIQPFLNLSSWQEICEVLANETVMRVEEYCNNLLFELCEGGKSKDCFQVGVDYYYPKEEYSENSLARGFRSKNKWVKPSQSFKPFLIGFYIKDIYLVLVENDVLRIGNLYTDKWKDLDESSTLTYTFGFNQGREGLGGWYSRESLLFPMEQIRTFNFPRAY